MTVRQPTSRARATQAGRRAARLGTLAIALALSTVIGPVVDGSSGPAEAATRTYTYKVCYEGRIVVSKPYFKKFVAATYANSRGWRRAGIRFVRKDFTCTRLGTTAFPASLAVPSYIDNFAGCSATYSCRYGRHVMINQARWRHAVSFWPQVPGLRGYRRMVVNHETGHWLGQHHRNCPRPRANAPVMPPQAVNPPGRPAAGRPPTREINPVRPTAP